MIDPKLQAFLEDLVAVYAKHQLWIFPRRGQGVTKLPHGEGALAIDGYGDLDMFDADEAAAIRDRSKCLTRDIDALALFPTTAHARLQAAARVASLADEDGSLRETVDAIEEALRETEDVGEYASLEAVFALAGGGPTGGDFRRLMQPIFDAFKKEAPDA